MQQGTVLAPLGGGNAPPLRLSSCLFVLFVPFVANPLQFDVRVVFYPILRVRLYFMVSVPSLRLLFSPLQGGSPRLCRGC